MNTNEHTSSESRGGSEEEQSTRRPFEFLTNIFKRRREHDCETETEDEASRPPDITLHGASLTPYSY
ncbi:hypothetical protein E2C01_069652 [Portunus trituberculatus]|uniref:Uncharacterized protein n=1 Tax=Portunus trituberculatus TaxID=210409 RepID=A0A5B7I1D5_PORTR|nr:hypothetical protein [Portunus trituberculatus]